VLYSTTGVGLYYQTNSVSTPEQGHIPTKGEPGYSEEVEQAKLSGNMGLYHKIAGREMRRWILKHPVQFFRLGVGKLLIFMNWNRKGGVWPIWHQYYEGSYDPARPLEPRLRTLIEEYAFVSYYILFHCFIFSIALIAIRWPSLPKVSKSGLLILGACFLFWLLEHMLIYPDRKYRYPLEPIMLVSAAFLLDHILFVFRWGSLGRKVGGLFRSISRS